MTINASPIDGEQPIEPTVLLANHFGLDGGTKTKLSDSELVAILAVSVPFWANKTNATTMSFVSMYDFWGGGDSSKEFKCKKN